MLALIGHFRTYDTGVIVELLKIAPFYTASAEDLLKVRDTLLRCRAFLAELADTYFSIGFLWKRHGEQMLTDFVVADRSEVSCSTLMSRQTASDSVRTGLSTRSLAEVKGYIRAVVR